MDLILALAYITKAYDPQLLQNNILSAESHAAHYNKNISKVQLGFTANLLKQIQIKPLLQSNESSAKNEVARE